MPDWILRAARARHGISHNAGILNARGRAPPEPRLHPYRSSLKPRITARADSSVADPRERHLSGDIHAQRVAILAETSEAADARAAHHSRREKAAIFRSGICAVRRR